jgi:hypothetical protein
MFGVTYTYSKSMDGAQTTGIFCRTPTMPATCRAFRVRYTASRDHRLPLRSTLLQEAEHACRQAALEEGKSRAQSSSKPGGRAGWARRTASPLLVSWKLRMRIGRSVLDTQRAGHGKHRNLWRSGNYVQFPHLLRSKRNGTRGRNLKPATGCPRLRVRSPFQDWNLSFFKKFAINERSGLQVPGGSIRLHQSSKPE